MSLTHSGLSVSFDWLDQLLTPDPMYKPPMRVPVSRVMRSLEPFGKPESASQESSVSRKGAKAVSLVAACWGVLFGVLFRVMVRTHFCSIDGRVLLGAFFGAWRCCCASTAIWGLCCFFSFFFFFFFFFRRIPQNARNKPQERDTLHVLPGHG